MRHHYIALSALFLVSIFFLGCGKSGPDGGAAVSPDGARYRLTSEPADAQDVKAAKEAAKDGEEITVVGRIGGAVDPWFEGQAAFYVVDRALRPCNENPDDDCQTPWDYCCDTDVLPKHMAVVKFVDDSGKPVAVDARKLLGLKELQTVVVRGKAQRDDKDHLVVLADGIFVKKG